MNIEKVEKLVTNLHDETEYVIHIRNLNQTLNHGLMLKKLHRVIKFTQNAWLKYWYEYQATKKSKTNFERDFLKVVNAVFGKTMENVRKHRNSKLVTTESRRNYSASEPNFHTTKLFIENLLAIEMRETQILMIKPVYLCLSILDLSKTVIKCMNFDMII